MIEVLTIAAMNLAVLGWFERGYRAERAHLLAIITAAQVSPYAAAIAAGPHAAPRPPVAETPIQAM